MDLKFLFQVRNFFCFVWINSSNFSIELGGLESMLDLLWFYTLNNTLLGSLNVLIKNIKNGLNVLDENVKTAEKSVVKGVEPKKIQHAFKASKFNAEIAGVYPNEAKEISDLK
jgi:hypothetical protein